LPQHGVLGTTSQTTRRCARIKCVESVNHTRDAPACLPPHLPQVHSPWLAVAISTRRLYKHARIVRRFRPWRSQRPHNWSLWSLHCIQTLATVPRLTRWRTNSSRVGLRIITGSVRRFQFITLFRLSVINSLRQETFS
jgi:hypothetical protein